MSRRRQSGASSQNLDSLLDTMANVVGILIVLMAVTQLTVNDAFQRIRISETDHAEEVTRQRIEAERELAATSTVSLLEALETARLRAHVERLKSDPSAARVVDEASAATQLAETKLRVRRLEKRVGAKRAELASLRIHMEDYEAKPVPIATQLRLPDPRPAPPGAEPAVFFCRYGRVLYPNLERLQGDFFQVIRRAGGLSSAYFRDHDVGNRELRWHVMEMRGGQVARLDWRRPNVGETASELRNPSADFRLALSRYDPERNYVQFYVWGDSFEPYLEARRQAESLGYSVGWEAYEIGQSLKFARSLSTAPTPVD